MRRTRKVLIAALLGGMFAATASAQAPQQTRLVGKIEKLSGATLVVKTAAAEREVTLPADLPVFAIARAGIADIKPNSFVGVGATPQPDGSQKAIRVTIFPESMRGLGEGHRPWDRPGTTMTNATVENAVSSVAGQVLNVRYKDGEKRIVVGPEATIITFLPGERSELRPGANVAITAVTKGTTLEATRINVGRGDVVP